MIWDSCFRHSSIFSFQGQALITTGVGETVEFQGSLEHSLGFMQKKIACIFDRAKADGAPSSLIAGSLPFGDEVPGYLFCPVSFERVATSELRKKLALCSAAKPEITRVTELTGREHYLKMVQKALNSFSGSGLEKIVLTRAVELGFSKDLSWEVVFKNLLDSHQDGFCFSVLLSQGRRLLGASPELLVERQGSSVHSNPLAGSRVAGSGSQENRRKAEELLSNKKERREHAIVVKDICKRLRPFCGNFRKPATPCVRSTPTMMHLSTRISATLRDPSTNALTLAAALHPTPAVSGYPGELARKLIASWEPVRRGMFTGLTGWMDVHGNGQWFVTLRSGELEGNMMRLGAGAGIVPGSVPAAEWNETTGKLKTMLNAVQASCNNRRSIDSLSYLA